MSPADASATVTSEAKDKNLLVDKNIAKKRTYKQTSKDDLTVTVKIVNKEGAMKISKPQGSNNMTLDNFFGKS